MTGNPNREWKKFDVVQLNEHTLNDKFTGCFMMVTSPRIWGAVGFVQVPGGGRAFYRATHKEMIYVGEALLVPQDEIMQEEENVA